jgi:hypothetical protein
VASSDATDCSIVRFESYRWNPLVSPKVSAKGCPGSHALAKSNGWPDTSPAIASRSDLLCRSHDRQVYLRRRGGHNEKAGAEGMDSSTGRSTGSWAVCDPMRPLRIAMGATGMTRGVLMEQEKHVFVGHTDVRRCVDRWELRAFASSSGHAACKPRVLLHEAGDLLSRYRSAAFGRRSLSTTACAQSAIASGGRTTARFCIAGMSIALPAVSNTVGAVSGTGWSWSGSFRGEEGGGSD